MMKTRKANGGRKLRLFVMFIALAAMGAVIYLYRQELRDVWVDDTRYRYEIRMAADKYHLDRQLVRALVFQESRFDPDCIGRAGEVGLMQILPEGAVSDWAIAHGVRMPSVRELRRPSVNLDIGCFFLAKGMRRWRSYKYGMELALCQYNAGESRARKWAPAALDGEVLPQIKIATTKSYVSNIIKRYKRYKMEENDGKK